MYNVLKRLIDMFLSIVLIVVLFPFFLIVFFIIYFSIGSPVFFSQVRTGKNGKLFVIFKFRTMVPVSKHKVTDEDRLTKPGYFLRKLSIDEWPQLINILIGDMSFIGPRPLIPEYLPYYNSRESLRFNVRPGMTSLAGVMGRSNLTWEEQFELDASYVENMSLWLDLKIVMLTIPKVLAAKDMMVTGRKDKLRFDVYRRNQNPNKKDSPKI